MIVRMFAVNRRQNHRITDLGRVNIPYTDNLYKVNDYVRERIEFEYDKKMSTHPWRYGYLIEDDNAKYLVYKEQSLMKQDISILEILDFLDVSYDRCIWLK